MSPSCPAGYFAEVARGSVSLGMAGSAFGTLPEPKFCSQVPTWSNLGSSSAGRWEQSWSSATVLGCCPRAIPTAGRGSAAHGVGDGPGPGTDVPLCLFSPQPGHTCGHIPKPRPEEAASVRSRPPGKLCSGGRGTVKQWALLGKIVLQ